MAADEGSGYFQTGFWHVVKVVKSRNLFLTPKICYSHLGWSDHSMVACSLSSVQGDIALIKPFSVASTPDFIAGWSQLYPGISSRLSNARSKTRYDAQCHSCRISKGTRFKIQTETTIHSSLRYKLIEEWEDIWLTILACVHWYELITKLSFFCNNMRCLFHEVKWKNLIIVAQFRIQHRSGF